MANKVSEYRGANFGFDYSHNDNLFKEYSTGSEGTSYQIKAGEFGFPSNPQTANQVQAVSQKINTGAKTIEVSAVNIGGGEGPLGLLDNIPKQQFKEINRLKKLAGVDLTFHGPLVEATGIGDQGFDETRRKQAERQIMSAVERGHDLDPEGNIVITFHTTASLPELIQRTKKDGKTPEEDVMYVVNEREGRFGAIPKPKKDYFLKKEPGVKEELQKLNEENWQTGLTNASFNLRRGQEEISSARILGGEMRKSEAVKKELGEESDNALAKTYSMSVNEPENYNKFIDEVKKEDPNVARLIQRQVDEMTRANIFVRDSYNELTKRFNEAYQSFEKNPKKYEKELKQLDKFREETAKKIEDYSKDRSKVTELEEETSRGLRLLSSFSKDKGNLPEMFRPANEFAIEKAAQTFGDVAFQSYKQFEHGKKDSKSPVISLENPPAGSGISRAEDIKQLVEKSHDQFVKNAVDKLGMSESEARAKAEKLIGVTWDVGHINMIRKFGYDEKDVVKESEKIAPYVKHVHLSDNFGLEHTELPMGMGNVPTKQILDLHEKFKKAKKIVETGGWFRNFNNVTPFRETLQAFNSPMYSMKMAPAWNQMGPSVSGINGGYFSYGRVLPDVNFSTYGAGFSNLPTDVGGQIPGNRNRLSGTPME